MIKRYAAHWVITPEKNRLKQSIVELEEGSVTCIVPLTEETAFTEWIGGIIIVSSFDQCKEQLSLPMEMEQLISFFIGQMVVYESDTNTPALHAWHITPEDMASGIVRSLQRL